MFSLILVPLLALKLGRVALPISGNIRPLNLMTCVLNRHYVSQSLFTVMQDVSNRLNVNGSETPLYYLDANFPFIDGFPLLPHLSHNDGKKLDLGFYYRDIATGRHTDSSPSFIGYGAFEAPFGEEINYPERCRQDGYLMYNFLKVLNPVINKEKYTLDEERTINLLKVLSKDRRISIVFIEPHLKRRWDLHQYDKIRFQGCHAVRHDDHIHIQIF
jgi:hypothetical protein